MLNLISFLPSAGGIVSAEIFIGVLAKKAIDKIEKGRLRFWSTR